MDYYEDGMIEGWTPTRDDLLAYFKSNGWPVFADMVTSHIDDKAEQNSLQSAIDTVKRYTEAIKENRNGASLIIVASSVPGDMDRTGYGCGKTMLAKCAYYSATTIFNYVHDRTSTLTGAPQGRFYTSREVMALFDAENYDERHMFSQFRNMIVIDDLGREGALRWEKRDEQSQLFEKQSRYYNIINYCYQKKISMIITSNLSSRELAEFLGGASWSRLLQMIPKQYRVNMTGIRDMRPILSESDYF